jgi:hypothetical protein
MKTRMLFSFAIFSVLLFAGIDVSIAQEAGDYGTATRSNWVTLSTWIVCQSAGTWAGATAAATVPASSDNVWIRSGDTVVVEASGKVFNNLTVESGAVLIGANNLPTSSLRYIRAYGTTITNNGSIGTPTDVLGLGLYGGASQVLTITGTGTTYISRIQPQASGQAIVFDANVQIDYAGSGGTGSTALYCANGDFTVTINAGKTVTMAPYAYVSTHTSSGSTAGNANFTLNINGTLQTGTNAHINT